MTRPVGDPRTLRADAATPITVVRAGTVPYLAAWDWQRDLAARRAVGEVGDVLLLLEHPRVYTLGRRADETNLVFDEAERARRGIELHRIDRGGDVTYHGPGQLVGYPIFGLDGPRVVDHVRALEELNLRVAASFGITAERVEGYSGVWVGPRKVTAIGVHVTAGYVTTHGWATNVTTDLTDFDGIVPCGIDDPDKGVASLASLGAEATVDEAITRTERAAAEVYGARIVHADPADLSLVVGAAWSTPVGWLVVDAMNVIGSRPDGWWHDREGAVRDLVADIRAAVDDLADLVTVVVDGRGTEQAADGSGVEVMRAGGGPDAADDRIVELLQAADATATVVTTDGRLRDRVTPLGARVEGPTWLRRRTDPTSFD